MNTLVSTTFTSNHAGMGRIIVGGMLGDGLYVAKLPEIPVNCCPVDNFRIDMYTIRVIHASARSFPSSSTGHPREG